MLSLIEIGSVILGKIFKFCLYYLYFRNYLPFEKGVARHLNKFESPSPKDALGEVWLNWPSGSREEDENVKSLQTDDGRQAISKVT